LFRKSLTLKDEGTSHSLTQDEIDSFPPPPDSPPDSTEYVVGPHRYSLRDSQFTPEVAAQIAQEAVQHTDQTNAFDDESYDVQL